MKTRLSIASMFVTAFWSASADAALPTEELFEAIGARRGILAVVGLPQGEAAPLIDLAGTSGLHIYLQSADADHLAAARAAADEAHLLGRRIFVDGGPPGSIHLANNVADAVLVAESAAADVTEAELLRILRPLGTAFIGDDRIVKPVPEGIDEWTHPFHGPDNNPQSNDQYVRGEFQTQFLAEPMFSPMPEQSVAGGGRIYKVMGHIAHKENQNAWLNSLLCINAYNGTILWRRQLPEGFMIHRNTMIATDDGLLMGDHESCKLFDAETGRIRDEITVPEEITDGPVWKWMALRNGVLYGLVGNLEVSVETMRSNRRGLGHWPWGMWKGHDYNDPRTAFGYGRTLVAIDMESKEVIWHYRDEEFLDARAVCMNSDNIYCFCPEKFLACIDRETGELLFKNTDEDLLAAIGPNEAAQHYVTGYATTCYMKCSDQYLFFAGPQRRQMVVVSAINGALAWTNPVGNLQLVLREDAVYAAGPQNTTGYKFDYHTGSVLAEFPARRACTRATGCIDSIFFRANGGTVRVLTETNTAQHIAPMRPPCQDGVIISNGHLYWGPWMCGCQLSLYGNIALAPQAELPAEPTTALVSFGDAGDVKPLQVRPGDRPTYRGDNARSDTTETAIPISLQTAWSADVVAGELPTAPVTAGGMVFVADRTGVIHAFSDNGETAWESYASGPVYYPPAISQGRLYVGSADGRVYAFEAATGRLLWTYRVAPEIRRIPVFGRLISRWPVAGGVVVQDGIVYAAAGFTHYDGTYVVALDAVTGELKAENSTSGKLNADVNSGISLQGNLKIVDGELRFLAGGVQETARFDLESLECLNEPRNDVTSTFRTAFYPYYPDYGKYLSLEHTCGDGRTLCHDASYEGSLFGNLALQEPLPDGTPRPKKEAARWIRRNPKDPQPVNVWEDDQQRRFTSFIVSSERLLVAGHPDAKPDAAFLAAINIDDGTTAWEIDLPAQAVKGGATLDHTGRVYVSLENGQLLCFTPEPE
ncbi:MAG: hypothetical protein DWQ45_14185 [Planctomycetota bacterium]|nr:MAG: hypothetical protein DWQ41_09630 [Planctomycetota bacterium]REK33968.1 MAG: hypothetical protein DWQ45_14185 [Planctomycetota bacterium]